MTRPWRYRFETCDFQIWDLAGHLSRRPKGPEIPQPSPTGWEKRPRLTSGLKGRDNHVQSFNLKNNAHRTQADIVPANDGTVFILKRPSSHVSATGCGCIHTLRYVLGAHTRSPSRSNLS